MWPHLLHRLRDFAGGQALGWCLLVVLAALLGGVLLLLLRVLRPTSSLVPVVWTLGSSSLLVVLAAVRIANARQLILAPLLRRSTFGDPSEDARIIAVNLSRTFFTLNVVGPAIALAMLAMLVFLWRRPKIPCRALLGLAASLFLLTALSLRAVDQGLASRWQCEDSENLSACWFERASESLQPIRHAAQVLVVAAVLGSGVALFSAVRSARERSDGSKHASWVSTALLLVGVGAFWTTRAEHHDVNHLVPPDPDHVVKTWLRHGLEDLLPPAKSGCDAIGGPIVEFTPDGVFVDGARLTTHEDLRAVLVKKRELWEQLNPGQKFPARVLLAAPRSSKVEEVVAWLLALRAAGYSKLGVLLKVPTVELRTRTVGLLEKRRSCVEVWPIDQVHESAVTRFETWGDLVASF